MVCKILEILKFASELYVTRVRWCEIVPSQSFHYIEPSFAFGSKNFEQDFQEKMLSYCVSFLLLKNLHFDQLNEFLLVYGNYF